MHLPSRLSDVSVLDFLLSFPRDYGEGNRRSAHLQPATKTKPCATADLTLSFRALTDAFHADLIPDTRSIMADSLGVPAQIECFPIVPIAFPIPDCFTRDLVTGRSLMVVNKWSNKSTPPKKQVTQRSVNYELHNEMNRNWSSMARVDAPTEPWRIWSYHVLTMDR